MTLESDIQSYFARLDENPHDMGAIAQLESAFGASEQWGELVTAFHSRAEESESATLRARLLLESGRVAVAHLEDAELAAQLFNLAYETGQQTPVVWEVQLFALALRQQWEELEDFFAQAVEENAEPATQSRLYMQLGTVLTQMVGDPETAKQMYDYALQLDGRNIAAMRSRAALAAKESAWPRVAELLYAELNITEDAERQVELLLDLGDVYRTHLEQPDHALQCYENVYEFDPTNRRAIDGLNALGRDVSAAPDDEAPAMNGETDLDVDVSAAPIEDAMEDEQAYALEEVEPEEVDLEPIEEPPAPTPVEDAHLRETVEAESFEQMSGEEAPTALAPPAETPQTMELDEELIEEVSELEEAPDGDVHEDIAEDEEDVELEEIELEEVTPEEDVTEAAEDVAPEEDEEEIAEGEDFEDDEDEDDEAREEIEPEDREDDLDDVHPSEADVTAEGDDEDDEAYELDEIEEPEELGADESIVVDDFIDDVEEPEYTPPTWQEQVAALRDEAAEASEDARAAELLHTAALYEWFGRDGAPGDEALAIWQDAFERGVADVLYDNFSFRLEGADFWPEVMALTEEHGASAELRAKIALFCVRDYAHARTIAEEHDLDEHVQLLDDMEAAQDNWRKYQREVEQRYPDMERDERNAIVYDKMAKMAEALNDSENLLGALRRLDRLVDDPSIKGRLQGIYLADEKWSAYVELIKQEADVLPESMPRAKAALWREAIRVYTDQMNNDMQAVSLYSEILELLPEDRGALEELIALYEKNNRTSDQIKMLERKAELATSKRRTVEILSGIAQLYVEKFRNQTEAIKYYEQVLEIAPHYQEALDFLTEMYEKRREWEKLIDLKRREIATLSSRAERLASLKETAALAASNIRDPEVGIELWREALERAPEDVEVLTALEELYDRSRDYESLANIMERRAALLDDAEEQLTLYQKLGSLLSDRVEDDERAIAAWERALAIDPDNLKARKMLERLYLANQRWDDFEQLYARQDAYSDLARTLEQQVGGNLEDADKIELLLRSARVWSEHVEDISRAERALNRILQQFDERHEGAASELVDIYRVTENWSGLTEVYQILLSHREESEQRREVQRQLAHVHLHKLEDPDGALGWYAQILEEDPTQTQDAERLEEVAAQIDAWPAVVDLYERVLQDDALTQDEVAALRMRLGRVFAQELEQREDALAQHEAILAEDSEHTEALGAMARIYEAQERWDELMEIYQRRLELVSTPEERVTTLHGLARIAEYQANDVARALETYLEAYELIPDHEPTLIELHRLYADGEQWEELVGVITEEIELIDARGLQRGAETDRHGRVDVAGLLPGDSAEWEESGVEAPDLEEISEVMDEDDLAEGTDAEEAEDLEESTDAEADTPAEEEGAPEGVEAARDARTLYTEDEIERLVTLNFERGVVCKEHLSRPETALESLGRVILMRPMHTDALHEIEAYLDREEDAVRRAASELAEPVYEIGGRWTDLIRALTIQDETATEDTERAEHRARIASIYLEELGMPEQAFDVYGDWLRVEPGAMHARAQLTVLADALGQWSDLIALYEEILPETGAPGDDLRTSYAFEIAQMYAEHAAEPDRAREYYYKILDADPENARALDELEALFERAEQWRDLLDVYERRLALAEGDADEVRRLRFGLATLWEERLDEPQEAIDVLRANLEAHPDDEEALSYLDSLLRHEERWEELAENLRHQLELADEEQARATLEIQLGEVHEHHLDDAGRAVDLYEGVLGRHPEDDAAREALERVMGADDVAVAERVSHILEPWYVERQQWRPLVDALEVQVAASEDPAERIELLHRIAELWESRLVDPMEAMETYARALAEDVHDEDSKTNLYRIAEGTTEWERLVEVLEEIVEDQNDPEVKRDLLRQASTIYLEHIGDVESTAARLHDVIDIMPHDLETIEDLEQIYRQLQDWERLVDILTRKAEVVEDVEDKKELLYQAGTLYEEVLEETHEEAIDVYNVVLGIDPVDTHAIDRLEVLYTQHERWVDLLEIYNKKLDLAEDVESKKDLLYVIGGIHQGQLDEPMEAIDVYRRILDLDEQELGALEKLDELYEATEQWNELLTTLEREIELSHMPEDQKTLKWRVGRLWEEHLDDGLRAVEVYAEVLEEDPDHVPSRDALAGMVERGAFEVEAAQVLQPIYEANEQWDDLIHVMRLLLGSTEDDQRRLEILREIASIHEGCRDDKGSAFTALGEALAVDPANEDVLDQLERLAEELYAWDPLIDLLDELLETTQDSLASKLMQLRVARVYEERLGDAGAAIDRYRRVMEQDPVDETALPALHRLYQQEGRWEELAEILRTRIDQTLEPDERLNFRLQLGTLLRDALDDIDAALEVYRDVLTDEPGNADAIASLEEMFTAGQNAESIAEILEPHYLSRDEHQKLVDLYSRRLEMLDDSIERHDLYMQIARLHIEEMGQEVEALQSLSAALYEVPSDEEIVAEMERIAQAHEQWPVVAQTYMTVLEEGDPSDVDALRLWLNLAETIDDKLGMPADAEGPYLNALSLDPGHPGALEALDRIYREQQSWEELAGILERRVAEVYDDEKLIELNMRLARLLRDQLMEPEEAIERFEAVLHIDPVHREALEALEQLFFATQQESKLYDNLQTQAEVATDPDRQADLYGRMAQITDEPNDAIQLLDRVLERQPDNRDALERLRRLHLQEERWEDLVDVIEAEISLSDDEEEKLGLYENLGVIWGERLDDEVRALDAWTAALNIDENYLPALEAMRDLHTRRSDYFELSNILRRMLEHPDVADERRVELWIEQAEIQSDMLMQPAEAIEAWRQVMMLDPGNALAMENLERLYLQEGHWEEAVGVLDAKLDGLDEDAARLETAEQIADLLRRELAEPQRAASYYEFVLEIDPTHPDAYVALEQIYLEQGDEEAMTSLVNLYLTHAEVADADAHQRLETLQKASRVFEQELSQPESALLVLLSGITSETIVDEDVVADAERLAAETGLWSEVVERYEGVLQEIDDEIDAFEVHRHAGRLLAEQLDQPDEAIYHYQRALTVDPESIEVLDKLADLFRRVADWPELAKTLRQRVELTIDPEEQIRLHRQLGEVYETQLMEVDEAVAAYERVLEIDEADVEAMESLQRLFEAYERWEELIEVLQQRVQTSYDPDEQVRLRYRVAVVYEEHLQDTDAAINAYNEVLQTDQGHIPSLEALERLYTWSERWHDALDNYERQLNAMMESEQQVTIYGKMAAVHEDQFQDLDSAINAYNQILLVDPESEAAIQNLERLFYSVERWFELVETVERHVQLTEDVPTEVQLLNELARVHRDRLDDPHSAIEAFARSLEVDPDQKEPRRELGLLYEMTSNWEAAVETYDRLAVALPDEARLQMLEHTGELLSEQMMDDVRAEESYKAALQISPTHDPAIGALRGIYERRGQWQEIIQMLKRADDASRDLTEKAHYMAQVGKIYDDELDDLVSAQRYFEQAYEYDPEVIEASEPLIDLYMREQRWERALPLLERVLGRYERGDVERSDEVLHKRHLQMARISEELGFEEQSLDYYHRAYEYDSNSLDGLMGLGRQLMSHEDFEAAFKIYQNIQLQHLEHLNNEDAKEVFFNAGLIKQRVGDRMRAIDYFEKVLDYDAEHKESINALLENYETAEEWDRYIDLTRQLLSVEDDPNVRFAKLSEIGDIYAQKTQDPGMAVQAYLEALDIQPKSVIVTRKLLDLYTKTRQWLEAVDMLQRLIELEDEPTKQARFSYTIGVIFRDEVKDMESAIEHFDQALDMDVHQLKAFEAIDRIFTEQKEWKELERAYRRMLKRVAEVQEQEEEMRSLYMMLWQNLGEIYRSRLGHYQSAIQAYEMAAKLNPNNEKVHLILAQLYERVEDDGDGAIEQHRALIENNPFRIDSYRALFNAYLKRKEFDKAWCMASALTFLESAKDAERKFYQKYLGKNLQAAKVTLNIEAMRKLYYPEQDMLTTAIMRQLYVAFAGAYSRSHKEAGINKKKDQLDPNDKLLFCKIYTYIAERLAPVGLMPQPELYLRRDQAIGMRNANVMPPAFVVGGDMFQGRGERDLAFIISKRLCWMLPEHYLGSCGYPTEWLKAFFMIALHVTDPSLGLDKQVGPNAQSLIEALQDADRSSPGLMVNIQKLARQFLQSGKNPNLSRWLTHVDHTTSRLGLLLCGDLHRAASCVKNDPIPVGKASVKEKIRELVLFSISEEYFTLRDQLGLKIG